MLIITASIIFDINYLMMFIDCIAMTERSRMALPEVAIRKASSTAAPPTPLPLLPSLNGRPQPRVAATPAPRQLQQRAPGTGTGGGRTGVVEEAVIESKYGDQLPTTFGIAPPKYDTTPTVATNGPVRHARTHRATGPYAGGATPTPPTPSSTTGDGNGNGDNNNSGVAGWFSGVRRVVQRMTKLLANTPARLRPSSDSSSTTGSDPNGVAAAVDDGFIAPTPRPAATQPAPAATPVTASPKLNPILATPGRPAFAVNTVSLTGTRPSPARAAPSAAEPLPIEQPPAPVFGAEWSTNGIATPSTIATPRSPAQQAREVNPSSTL
jgi:hypothetical protein